MKAVKDDRPAAEPLRRIPGQVVESGGPMLPRLLVYLPPAQIIMNPTDVFLRRDIELIPGKRDVDDGHY
jgi:hypothetical protein